MLPKEPRTRRRLSVWSWKVAAVIPIPLPGPMLHRLGLRAAAGGSPAAAERFFDRATAAYRMDLDVDGFARVRTHQLMARARAAGRIDAGASLIRDVERRLHRLGSIESPAPPFAVVDACEAFETWLDTLAGAGPPCITP